MRRGRACQPGEVLDVERNRVLGDQVEQRLRDDDVGLPLAFIGELGDFIFRSDGQLLRIDSYFCRDRHCGGVVDIDAADAVNDFVQSDCAAGQV